ncbi:hypothetical protein [Pararcticibacter amylolyticus]|uniref:DUF4890 domain-containing protein n=1 Tax=Pararcticibacter amylolyticus TaxID=2173175 RepID=A0A2U2PMR1_9SPHI|nr:hypothetical protein [Pararcticibacter amylolyticus]PWG82693.1 hypothetical protein DDR33_02230 [Pararcticibacter amylolyticus]
MKKLTTLILCLLVASAVSLRAQTKMTDEQRQEALAKYGEFKAKLNLSEQQKKKVDAVNAEFAEGLSALRSSGDSKMAKYRKFSTLRSKRDAQMKEILDEDQYKEYKKFQAEMKEDFKNNRKSGSKN